MLFWFFFCDDTVVMISSIWIDEKNFLAMQKLPAHSIWQKVCHWILSTKLKPNLCWNYSPNAVPCFTKLCTKKNRLILCARARKSLEVCWWNWPLKWIAGWKKKCHCLSDIETSLLNKLIASCKHFSFIMWVS
jgi:hypothetical protein